MDEAGRPAGARRQGIHHRCQGHAGHHPALSQCLHLPIRCLSLFAAAPTCVLIAFWYAANNKISFNNEEMKCSALWKFPFNNRQWNSTTALYIWFAWHHRMYNSSNKHFKLRKNSTCHIVCFHTICLDQTIYSNKPNYIKSGSSKPKLPEKTHQSLPNQIIWNQTKFNNCLLRSNSTCHIFFLFHMPWPNHTQATKLKQTKL